MLLLDFAVQKREGILVSRKQIVPLLVLLVLVLMQHMLLARRELVLINPSMSPLHIESLGMNVRMVVHHRWACIPRIAVERH
jgi:hypothetical protein